MKENLKFSLHGRVGSGSFSLSRSDHGFETHARGLPLADLPDGSKSRLANLPRQPRQGRQHLR